MNLLPKNHQDFRQNEYWESFFKKRGQKAFEWYGEYGELCGVLHKYIKPQEQVLVVGCGNSTLSEDLYDVGYHTLTNIDLSDTVIKQMKQKNDKRRPGLLFETMDATKMSYADSAFSVVLDKGTLDAMFPMGDKSAQEVVEKMFSEIDRVLRVGGRYICISLLQQHILEHMVKWFADMGWPIRILRCREVEESKEETEKWKFPVFAVVATKFKKMNNMQSVLEMGLSNGGNLTRLKTTDDLINSVRGLQQFSAARAGGSFLGSGDAREEEASLDLLVPNSNQIKYSLYLVDRVTQGGIKFAVFIVPQGREVEWLFNSKDGRVQLAESANCQRLVVVHLQRDQVYTSLDQIKEELSGYAMELAPSDLPPNSQVPFLSLGGEGEVGSRKERCRGKSKLSGEFVVEDVQVNGEIYRRLIFFNNPKLIQSECRIKKGKDSKKSIDPTFLACNHHSVIMGSFGFFDVDKKSIRCLVIGLGGGALPSYIQTHIKNVDLHVVEIDDAIIRVAEEQFGFQTSNTTKVYCEDGLNFVQNYNSSGASGFDIVILDVDSKDPTVGMSSPPKSFIESEFLKKLKTCIAEQGLFVLNLACRDQTLRSKVIDDVKVQFPFVVSYNIPEEVNEVLYCSPVGSRLHHLAEGKKKFEPTLEAFRKVNQEIYAKIKTEPIDLHQSMKQLKIV